jgi:hypothetical protein
MWQAAQVDEKILAPLAASPAKAGAVKAKANRAIANVKTDKSLFKIVLLYVNQQNNEILA